MVNAKLLSLILALTAALWGRAEDAPRAEQVEHLVRDFALASSPNLNTNTVFQIRKLEVSGLWESMRLEVFDVAYTAKDVEWFYGFVGLCSRGKVSVLAPNLGGYGLMSGLMHNGEFYYTYSWGSGVHRSHVAKLHLVHGELEAWDSGGFQDKDLFVTASPDGKVHVISGEFKRFNHWEGGTDIGFVGITNSSALQIVGPRGEIIHPTFPHRIEKSQQDCAANGSQPFSSGYSRGFPELRHRHFRRCGRGCLANLGEPHPLWPEEGCRRIQPSRDNSEGYD